MAVGTKVVGRYEGGGRHEGGGRYEHGGPHSCNGLHEGGGRYEGGGLYGDDGRYEDGGRSVQTKVAVGTKVACVCDTAVLLRCRNNRREASLHDKTASRRTSASLEPASGDTRFRTRFPRYAISPHNV